MNNTPDPRTLGGQNREVLQPYLQPLPDAVQESVLQQLQQQYESTVAPSPPAVDDFVPDFTLADAQGNEHRLSNYTQPVVLSFFRGGWCPACTIALKALQRRYAAITTHGGQVLAISPDPADANNRTAKKLQLSFALLSDTDNKVADLYGLRLSLAPLLAPIYRQYDIEFPQDCDRLDVPYPATFIVRPNGQLAQAFVSRDPAVRMDPQDIAGIIRQLAQV